MIVRRFLLLMFLLATPSLLHAQTIVKIDPFNAPRQIPGLTGGVWTVQSTQIIDVVIMADGYFASEQVAFFAAASNWYSSIIASNTGIRPYGFFEQAFRVQAIFNASTNRANANRTSYFQLPVTLNGTGMNDAFVTDTNVIVFRQRIQSNLVAMTINRRMYPANIDTRFGNPIPLIHHELSNSYSHLTVVMLVVGSTTNGVTGNGNRVGAFTRVVPLPGFTNTVSISFAERLEHEFQHSFIYNDDEYIFPRFDTNGNPTVATRTNPGVRSIYNTANLTFSHDRGAQPWLHLSAGNIYNPDLRSTIGGYFVGGEQMLGVWHSEHKCLMLGESNRDDFKCMLSDTNTYFMRDLKHLCFWCEELCAMRIAEKTGQFERPGDPADINARGITWYQRWENGLRDAYYMRFDIPSLIAEKNAGYYFHYDGVPCPPQYTNCANAVASQNPAPCLRDCDMYDAGAAIYVNSSATGSMDGSRSYPFNSVTAAIWFASTLLPEPHLVLIETNTYLAPIVATNRATLMPAGCAPVRLGP